MKFETLSISSLKSEAYYNGIKRVYFDFLSELGAVLHSHWTDEWGERKRYKTQDCSFFPLSAGE